MRADPEPLHEGKGEPGARARARARARGGGAHGGERRRSMGPNCCRSAAGGERGGDARLLGELRFEGARAPGERG